MSNKNLSQAKDKIARTMDNIVAGFEQQLDRLLIDPRRWTSSGDIHVMETMLRRDRGAPSRTILVSAAARPYSRRMKF